MAYRIVYHREADAELDKLYADVLIAAGAMIADDFIDGLLTFIEDLAAFPDRGTVRPSTVPGLRIIGYRRSVSVAFSVREDVVLILGILARGRNVTSALLEERDRC